MRYFKLKTLSVSALNNRVLRKEADEVYMETAWERGKADKLVADGALIEVNEDGSALTGSKASAEGKPVGTLAAKPAPPPPPAEPEKEEEAAPEETDGFDPDAIAAAMAGEDEGTEAEATTLPDYDAVTKKEIQAELEKLGISFEKNDSKKSLYAKWQDAVEQ